MNPTAAGAPDTIFALSSGSLPAGIAVVRISGPAAGDALKALAGAVPPARQASLRAFRDKQGMLLDRGLALFFPGPNSATGEDLAELHLHGGKAVVAAVLAALAEVAGLRAATAGEFTRRALLNGRLDLAEVEGLSELLAADTERQRRQALRLAEGGLARLITPWNARLLRAAAQIEAVIEFGEDEEDVYSVPANALAEISALADEIGATLRAPPAERLRDGLRVVLAGPVNAGKSSLLNALAAREIAITADVAGTTRDLIEVPIRLGDISVLLIDGAGLRDSTDAIEAEGIVRMRRAIEGADILLWLGLPHTAPQHDHVIRVHARCDISDPSHAAASDVSVSAVTGEGLPALREQIVRIAGALLPPDDGVALNARHRTLLTAARDHLDQGMGEADLLLVAEHVRLSRQAFDAVTGASGVEEMLDALFGQFCIGK